MGIGLLAIFRQPRPKLMPNITLESIIIIIKSFGSHKCGSTIPLSLASRGVQSAQEEL